VKRLSPRAYTLGESSGRWLAVPEHRRDRTPAARATQTKVPIALRSKVFMSRRRANKETHHQNRTGLAKLYQISNHLNHLMATHPAMVRCDIQLSSGAE
jgi:hypothetical protein